MYVFLECLRFGLFWQGVIHDLSKFWSSEWGPYVDTFYGKRAIRRDATGYYKPTGNNDAFDFAWLLHQKRNRHHWQWFLLPEDEGGFKVLEMPLACRKEMLADWRGAGRAQGKPDTLTWYTKNRMKMQLGPETRAWIEAQLGYQE